MERKTLVAIAVSLAVVLLWDVWYYHRYKDTLASNRLKAAQKLKEAPAAAKQAAPGGQPPPAQEAAASKPSEPAPAPQEKISRNITINTGDATVTVSTAGGVITSYRLLKYKDAEGKPTELAASKAGAPPLALEFATPEVSQKINGSVFNSTAPDNMELSEQNPTASVPLTLTLENGVTITKTLDFQRGSYLVGLRASVSGPGVAGSTFGISWNGLGGEEGKSQSYVGPVVLVDDKRLADAPKEKGFQAYEGNISWGGLTNKYYCAAFILPGGKARLTAARTNGEFATTLQLPAGSENRLAVYAGPKDHEELKKVGHGFIRMINYGWFDVLANPLFSLLIFFNSVIGNFGISIILLTVGVKLLFWPLSQSSFRSVEKMKRVQPEMKMLQERYKNDRMKQNEELIALYKKHGINPMAGCLPIFLQIPVFVALYKVLLESIDLKGAPFLFWIHDLSTKDPYYVTPVLMGVSMFAQQRMSPSSADPLQRKLMMAMPVVFTAMFLKFPSGLVIYWLVNNLLSIFQQYLLIRQNKEA